MGGNSPFLRLQCSGCVRPGNGSIFCHWVRLQSFLATGRSWGTKLQKNVPLIYEASERIGKADVLIIVPRQTEFVKYQNRCMPQWLHVWLWRESSNHTCDLLSFPSRNPSTVAIYCRYFALCPYPDIIQCWSTGFFQYDFNNVS